MRRYQDHEREERKKKGKETEMQYLEWRSSKHEDRSREESEITAKKEREEKRLRLEYKE